MVHTDVPAEHGGRGECFSPPELASAALGTCLMSVVAIVAERNGLDVSKMNADLTMEMTASPASRIGSIKAVIRLPDAKDVSDAVRQKLEAAANACPVKNSLHPDINVSVEFIYG